MCSRCAGAAEPSASSRSISKMGNESGDFLGMRVELARRVAAHSRPLMCVIGAGASRVSRGRKPAESRREARGV